MTISRGLLTCRRAAGPRLVAQNPVRPPDPVGLHTMIARPAPRGTPEAVFDSDTLLPVLGVKLVKTVPINRATRARRR